MRVKTKARANVRRKKRVQINRKKTGGRIILGQNINRTGSGTLPAFTIPRIAPVIVDHITVNVIAAGIAESYGFKKCVSIARQMISLLKAKNIKLNEDIFTNESTLTELLGYLVEKIEKSYCSKEEKLVAHICENDHFVLSLEHEYSCRFGYWTIDLIDIKKIKNRKLRLITEKFFSFLLNKANIPSFDCDHFTETYLQMIEESRMDCDPDDKQQIKWFKDEYKKYSDGIAIKELARIERMSSDDLLTLVEAYKPKRIIEKLMMVYIKETVTKKVDVQQYDNDVESDESPIRYSENNQILYDSRDYMSQMIIDSMNERWENCGTIGPIVAHHLIRGKKVNSNVSFAPPDFIYIEKYFRCFNLMIYKDEKTTIKQ